MTQEEKDLLLKDLCSRLPYGVKGVNTAGFVSTPFDWYSAFTISDVLKYKVEGSGWRPYLFPLSSMTEEQKKELYDKLTELELKSLNDEISRIEVVKFEIEYYLKNHLDYKGLIPLGLAIDATNLNIY